MASNSACESIPKIKTVVLNVFNAADLCRTRIMDKRDADFNEVKTGLTNYFSESMKAILTSAGTSENVMIPKTPAKKRRRSQVLVSSAGRLSLLVNRSRQAKTKANNKILNPLETSRLSASGGSCKLRLSSESESDQPSLPDKKLGKDDKDTSSERSLRRSKRSNVTDLNQSTSRLSFKVPAPSRKTTAKSGRLSRKRNASSKVLSTTSTLESISSEGEVTETTELPDPIPMKTVKRSTSKSKCNETASASILIPDQNEESLSNVVPPPSSRALRSQRKIQTTEDKDFDGKETDKYTRYSFRNNRSLAPLVKEKVNLNTSRSTRSSKVEGLESRMPEMNKMEALVEISEPESTTIAKSSLKEVPIPTNANEIESRTTRRSRSSSTTLELVEERLKVSQMEPSVKPKVLSHPTETTKQNRFNLKNVPKSKETPFQHETPIGGRISSPLKLRNSLRPRVPISPKSPRQLFSPYVNQTVKSKAAIYETLKHTPIDSQIKKPIPQTIILKPKINSPIVEQNENSSLIYRKSGRKSIIMPSGITQNLFLAKYDRMTISQKRRSSVRLSIAAVKNQIYRNVMEKRKSQEEKEATSLAAAAENSDESDKESEYESADSGDEDQPSQQQMTTKKRSKDQSITVPIKKMKTTAKAQQNSFVRSAYPGSENRQTGYNRIPVSNKSRNSTDIKKPSSVGRIGSVQKIASTFGTVSATLVPVQQKKHDHWLEKELNKMKEKEKVVLQNKEKILKEKMEISKKKNEEKQMRVLQKRQEMFKAKQERKRTIELKQEQHAQRKQELEQKRKEELEKRRKEEMAMKLKMQAIRNAQLEEERKREYERMMEEQSKPPVVVTGPNKPKKGSSSEKPLPKHAAVNKVVNETFNADVSEVGVYDITPHHSELPPQKLTDPEDYDINDLNSEDDTDDECAPRKQIPSWANGVKLHLLLRRQYRSQLNPDEIFPSLDVCQEFDLSAVFPIQRRRFFNRTSSAVWHIPPHVEGQKF